MEDRLDNITEAGKRMTERSTETLDKLFEVARPESVFSRPVQAGEATIITASEVSVGMGLGFGSGYDSEEEENEMEFDLGMGGGGGGFSAARPVAAIIVDENGVYIEPIVDRTKIALAFFTAAASMLVMLARINKSK